MYSQDYDTQIFMADMPRKDPLPLRKVVMIISACFVFAATVGITLFSIDKMFTVKYEHAVALMDSNNLLKAKEEFLSFSGYRDSSAKAQECQNIYDFDAADKLFESGDYAAAKEIFVSLGDYGEAPEKALECDYETAMSLMNSGKPQEAKNAFLALGDYSDSKEQARQCQKEIEYIAATELLNQQDYTNALVSFKSLGYYKDSAEKVKECQDSLNNIAYLAATELLIQKDYANALIAFKSLGYYKDSDEKAQECQNNLDYIKADKAYKDKLFYTAYATFSRLGDFLDSAKRASKCIQKNPASGQIYRNSKYSTKTCPLTFKTPKSGYSIFIKIYKGNTLVSTVFIASGKNVTVKLPAGTYMLKAAIGANWFGQNEAFGDENAYYGIIAGTYTMQSGWAYTVTFGAAKGNSEGVEIGRGDF